MRRRLTVEDLARRPEPGMDGPGPVRFVPGARSVSYLASDDGSLVRSLWRHDLEDGTRSLIVGPPPEMGSEATISTAEALVRERMRLLGLGVTTYAWASNAPAPTLLVPLAGRLVVGRPLAPGWTGESIPGVTGALAPTLSPDGSHVAFSMNGEIHLAEVDGGRVTRVSHDAGEGIFNGAPEFAAAEELDRFDGSWWSADSASIAYAHVDERDVVAIPIGEPADGASEMHHYPFAGGPNAVVTLRVVARDGGRTHQVPLGMGRDDYLARVVAHPDGGWLVAALPRDQRSLRWYRVGPDASAALLWVEEADTWINLDDDTRVLADGRILRSTERTGFRHLELRSPAGELTAQLTTGEWAVSGVVDASAERDEVLITGTYDGVLERHLYAVPLSGREPVAEPARLTPEAGWHEIVASPDGGAWLDTFSDLEHAPRVTAHARNGPATVIHESTTGAAREGLAAPQLIEMTAADGTTPLHAAVYRPPGGAAAGGTPPAVLWVYAGPHSQNVKRGWEVTVHRLRQYLCQAGATVVVVDNRGTAWRGQAFESAIAGRLGSVEVADQATVIRQLGERGELDLARVGVVGGSYGGFMVVMAMALEPDLFRTGVAIAPVAEWSGYDTAYSERYLGSPQERPEAYRRSSALSHAARVRGDLLLIHGTSDENVHLRHSLRLLGALEAAGHPAPLLRLHGQRHVTRADALRTRERATAAHLIRGLGLPLPDELA